MTVALDDDTIRRLRLAHQQLVGPTLTDPAAVVSHQHLPRGPLGQGANQPQHLRRIAVGENDIGEGHRTR